MIVFWISLTLWLSKRLEMKGIFQVAFWLIRSETTILEEWRKLGKDGEGEKEGIDGTHGEFQIGIDECL
jgi:hypothetical protein